MKADLEVVDIARLQWPLGRKNTSAPVLAELALAAGGVSLASTGALVAETAPRTGRSPKDKFIVCDATTVDRVAWGGFNTKIAPEAAARLQERIAQYLQQRQTYVVDAWAGADPTYRLGVRVVAEYAWHALFAHQLFLRTSEQEQQDFLPGFTVLVAPELKCDPERDGVRSEAAIILDFGRRLVTIAGTKYAGEIKKSVFSYLNFVLPERDVLPMHCSANVGADGNVALFFGLSGTGKTTLSADPARSLVGDDEHGWSSAGVFNFEGGCYAKCVNLKRESEPQIYDAIKFGTVLENVILDPDTRAPQFDDIRITENTRAAYPIDFIHGSVPSGQAGHPNAVVFLSADAFGVLPPVARLDVEQALYYFLSGYTAKLAGTEAGHGLGTGSDVQRVLWRAVPGPAGHRLRQHAARESAEERRPVLPAEYGLDRRPVRRGQAFPAGVYSRHGQRGALRRSGHRAHMDRSHLRLARAGVRARRTCRDASASRHVAGWRCLRSRGACPCGTVP